MAIMSSPPNPHLQSIFLQGPIAKELKPILFHFLVVDPRKHTYEIFTALLRQGYPVKGGRFLIF